VRVLQVIPSYPPATAFTGPPASLHRMCKELRSLDVDARVATTNDDGPRRLTVEANRWTEFEGVPVFYGDRWGRKGDLSPALHRCIQRETRDADLVHAAAIFSWPTLSASRACRRFGAPLVVSPRGSFAQEALAWRSGKKKAFMALGGRAALGRARAFHATTEREAEDVLRLFPQATVGVVPNGVEVPSDEELARMGHSSALPTLLYLGRLHSHKNVELLLRAWARAAVNLPASWAVFAGPSAPGALEALNRLAAELGVAERVSFPGLVVGQEKGRLLAQASVVALASKSENFGNAIAEALAYGTPAIASKGTPWAGMETEGCGWWVEAEEGALARAIGTALSLSPERRHAMGLAGRSWMRREFAWPAVGARMRDFYAEVVHGDESRSR
jgi:glycosyltransferase involved in cell wall biosynthesis